MLRTHPKVHAFGEIFSQANSLSYFHFLRKIVSEDPDAILPDRTVQNFNKYVQWCREHARDANKNCQVMIFSVKYDQTHLICEPWWRLGNLPRLFYLIREKKWNVIDIHRKDPVRLCISNQVAIHTKIYHSTALGPGQKISAKINLDPALLLREIASTEDTYRRVSEHFSGNNEYLRIFYEEMFADEQGTRFSAGLIDSIASFLGLVARFDDKPALEKLLRDDAFSYLENEQEIRAALSMEQDSTTDTGEESAAVNL